MRHERGEALRERPPDQRANDQRPTRRPRREYARTQRDGVRVMSQEKRIPIDLAPATWTLREEGPRPPRTAHRGARSLAGSLLGTTQSKDGETKAHHRSDQSELCMIVV